MATRPDVIGNKIHPITGENLFPQKVTQWQDGSTNMTDALVGGLYGKDSATGEYFRHSFSGEYPLERLVVKTEANFKKLMADFGTQPRTILVDFIVPITVSYTIPSNITVRIIKGGGFDVDASRTLKIDGPGFFPLCQIFFGSGNIDLSKNTFGGGPVIPEWFGAVSDGTTDDTPALNKAATSCAANRLTLGLFSDNYSLFGTFAVPENVSVIGMSVRGATLTAKTAGITMMTATSGTRLENFTLAGNKIAGKGLQVNGGNRIYPKNIRIEKINGEGLHVLVMNNSQFYDIFIQYCRVCIRLTGTLNCKFIGCNANNEATEQNVETDRLVLVDSGRNCAFWGGIYERGPAHYQIEVVNGEQIVFYNLEINNGSLANMLVRAGRVYCLSMHWSNGQQLNLLVLGGLAYCDSMDYTTGSNGRGRAELFQGNILWNESFEMPIVSNTFGSTTGGSAVGGGVLSQENGSMLVVASGASGISGVGIGLGTGSWAAPAGQIIRIRFVIKAISNGNPIAVYITRTGGRTLLGLFKNGYHDVQYMSTGVESYRIEILANEAVAKSWRVNGYKITLMAWDNNPDTMTTRRRIWDTDLPTINGVNMFSTPNIVTPGAGGSTIDFLTKSEHFTDFENGAPTTGDRFVAVVNGTGANASTNPSPAGNRIGISRLSTGTTNTGRAFVGSGIGTVIFGEGTWHFETAIKLNALSDGTDTYTLLVGFFDLTTALSQVDAACLMYNESTALAGFTPNAHWNVVTASNSVRTYQELAANTVDTAWTKIKILVNAAGTSAEFYINDVLVHTATVNIPIGATRQTGMGISIIKSVGANQSVCDADYMYYKTVFTSARP